jgi:hypothetical protein
VRSGTGFGLTATGGGHVVIDPSGLLLKPETALAEIAKHQGLPPPNTDGDSVEGDEEQRQPPAPILPRRFYASVEIDPNRAGRDVGRIAEEILQHLTSCATPTYGSRWTSRPTCPMASPTMCSASSPKTARP